MQSIPRIASMHFALFSISQNSNSSLHSTRMNKYALEPTVKEPIRTYLRLFSSMGIDPARSDEHQIVDGNTLIDKRKKKHLVLHPFTYIYTSEFHTHKQVEHMNIIDDCFEGKDQILIAEVDKEWKLDFMFGHSEDPGLVLSIFQSLFTQLNVCASKVKSDNKDTEKEQSISLSVFSTAGSSNEFTDLILGQKLSYFSKRDMDDYKDFYHKQISSLREFLILLKIVTVHYQQCCHPSDPLVFRIVVDSPEDTRNWNYSTTLHLVICERESKAAAAIARKLQYTLESKEVKGEDHGSLANYLERYFRHCKLIYLYGIPYRRGLLLSSVPMFRFMEGMKTHTNQFSRSILDRPVHQFIAALNQPLSIKPDFNNSGVQQRESEDSSKILARVCEFLQEGQAKWKNYSRIMEQILRTQSQFYERQRFPVSLEIHDYSVKSFLISKVYKLSETYQMEDLNLQMEKLRTIRNQVLISLKALVCSKQLKNLTGNKETEPLAQQLQSCLAQIGGRVKDIFSLRYRSVQIYNVKLRNQIKIDRILDYKGFKLLFEKMTQPRKQTESSTVLKNSDVRKSNQNSTRHLIDAARKSPRFTSQAKTNKPARHLLDSSLQQSFSLSVQYSRIIQNSHIKIEPSPRLRPYILQSKPQAIPRRQGEASCSQMELPKISILHRQKPYFNKML